MKLVIDTREQEPYEFKESVCQKLDFGDYALLDDGKPLFVFERKNPCDLFGSLTKNHERFIAEIERAKKSDALFKVIIECSYRDVYYKRFHGACHIKFAGWQLIKIVHSVMIKYDVEFVFCNDRTEARRYIYDAFEAFKRRIK